LACACFWISQIRRGGRGFTRFSFGAGLMNIICACMGSLPSASRYPNLLLTTETDYQLRRELRNWGAVNLLPQEKQMNRQLCYSTAKEKKS
jgi:hypothetical protein